VEKLKTNKGLHPSGMTWERWDWPFKTPQERKLVVEYMKKFAKEEQINAIEQKTLAGWTF
jgi:hypothetical protein